jgi:signal transduction histidine kinase
VYDGPDVVAGQGERRDGERQRRREADYTEHEDPDDVDQVLDVALDNAVTYAPGPIEILTERSGSRATMKVRDHGRGIAEEELPRVSERFYRGDEAPAGGSGLGLSIAKELVERWGGSITITSPEEGGTRVDVRLRAVEELSSP